MVECRSPRGVAMKACVTIESIAAGGDGVGHLDDGLAVFVPRTAPGDAVEVEVVNRKPRYARGRVVCLLSRGPDRVEPRCKHYRVDDCGGCQLQHLSVFSWFWTWNLTPFCRLEARCG